MRLAAAALACALTCSAQVAFQSLSSGLIYDPAASVIRPLLGIPGASRLGAALADGLKVSGFALGDSSALAAIPGDSPLVRWLAYKPELSSDPITIPSPAAELYVNRAAAWGFVRTEAGELCFLDRAASIPSCRWFGTGAFIAIADEKEPCLVVASAEGEVERTCDGAGPRRLGKFSRFPSVLTWLDAGKLLAAAFSDTGIVETLRVSDGEWRQIQTPLEAVAAMIAVGTQRLLLAPNAESADLIVFNIASGTSQPLMLPAPASRLRALPGDIVLGEGSASDVVVLLDAAADFESYLVPLPPPVAGGTE